MTLDKTVHKNCYYTQRNRLATVTPCRRF